jgi:hypothetical protein
MAEADLRVTRARKAASAFAEYAGRAMADVPSRDVATLRFMLAFEATWKAAQAALRERGLEATSPRAAIRGSRDEGWLDDADADDAGEMLADRNLAVHTYNEDLAADLATRLPRWSALIGRWVAAMGEAE